MQTKPFLLLGVLAAFAVGCGKDYKPDPNPTGGGTHKPIHVDLGLATGSAGGARGSQASLQGQWKVTRLDVTSNEADNAMVNQMMLKDAPTIVISGNTITFEEKKGRSETATFEVRPGSREIDLSGFGMMAPGAKGTALGLYELNGDTLRLAIQTGKNGPRPTEIRASNVALKDLGPAGDRPHVIVLHLQRIGGGLDPVTVTTRVEEPWDGHDHDLGPAVKVEEAVTGIDAPRRQPPAVGKAGAKPPVKGGFTPPAPPPSMK